MRKIEIMWLESYNFDFLSHNYDFLFYNFDPFYHIINTFYHITAHNGNAYFYLYQGNVFIYFLSLTGGNGQP